MTNEIEEKLGIAPEQQSEAPEAPETNERREEAIKKGWNPEGVPGKRNKTYEEFLEFENFVNEIKTVKNQLKEQEKINKTLIEHRELMNQKAYQKAKDELLKEAEFNISNNIADPADAIAAYEEQIKALESNQTQVADDRGNAEGVHPAAVEFVEKYADIMKDAQSPEHLAMQAYVASLDKKLEQDGIADVPARIEQIEQSMLKEFSHKFKQNKAPRVAGKEVVGNAKGGAKLTRDEAEIVEHFANLGIDKDALVKNYTKEDK